MKARLRPLVLLLCALLPLGGPVAAQVAFSQPGGMYEHVFSLRLTVPDGQQIRYTTDGSTPTLDAPLYQGPLTLSSALYSSRSLYLMPDAPDAQWSPPSSVSRAIVLRAQAFDPQGNPVGATATHTYFVADLMQHHLQLPALSITIDHQQLFGADSGIFSPNGWSSNDQFGSGNFNQHGREWERLAHVEFYELDNRGFAQPLGVRVHGGKTRQLMQKPLKLYARKEYGNKKIKYRLFQEKPDDSYKRLVLRPFCAALTAAGLQDLLAQRIAQPLKVLSLASRPVSLFINGEYWGIYFLQEAPDERLIEQTYGVEPDEVNIMGAWFQLENGSPLPFQQMMEWLRSADLSDDVQYDHFSTLFDIDDFIDYQLIESFIANQDWPANNTRCFQFHDAPWRWIFYDGDDCFTDIDRNMPYYATFQGPETWPSSAEATLFLRKLLASPQFAERFGRRLHQLISTTFDYDHTAPLLKAIEKELAPEIDWQSQRFGKPQDRDEWDWTLYNVDKFLKRRPAVFLEQFDSLIALHDAAHRYLLFPNPAHGQLYIQNNSDQAGWVQCQVHDLMGRVVLSSRLYMNAHPAHVCLPIAAIPAGIYLLRFSNSPAAYRLIIH